MLKSDRIELEVLNRVIGHTNTAGPEFRLVELAPTISNSIGQTSPEEVLDVLLVLLQDGIIAIGRYQGQELVPYDENEGTAFFYNGNFRCKARPAARRKQQELSRDNRHGIFISHITEEKPIALAMQKLLREALSPEVPVFVSSDLMSIESGDKWYEAILGGLKRSQVVIVLLSPTSVDRRWINFEAGFGMGQGSRVIPVVARGLSKNDIGFPLSQLQARDLHDERDLAALLGSIANICNLPYRAVGLGSWCSELTTIESELPRHMLQVCVFVQNDNLYLGVSNSGTRPLDLIDAELLIPEECQQNNNFVNYPPVRFKIRDGAMVGLNLTTQASFSHRVGIKPLPSTLTREMGEVRVDGLRIGLRPNLAHAEQETMIIRYWVSGRQESVGPLSISLARVIQEADGYKNGYTLPRKA